MKMCGFFLPNLDSVGLIHMNGRVYDPELGRFMSADPFVQAPYNSQSYNRYSYVFNNPLSFTDPSGYQACSGYNANDCPEETTTTGTKEQMEQLQLQRQRDAINASNIAYWSASQHSGEQWSYMNGAAYNIANFWGKVAFDLAAGGDGSTKANSITSFDLSVAAFWIGTTGTVLEQTKGYIGIHKVNYFSGWRFYLNGWRGNQ